MDSDRAEERRPRRHASKESTKKNAKSSMLAGSRGRRVDEKCRSRKKNEHLLS